MFSFYCLSDPVYRRCIVLISNMKVIPPESSAKIDERHQIRNRLHYVPRQSRIRTNSNDTKFSKKYGRDSKSAHSTPELGLFLYISQQNLYFFQFLNFLFIIGLHGGTVDIFSFCKCHICFQILNFLLYIFNVNFFSLTHILHQFA